MFKRILSAALSSTILLSAVSAAPAFADLVNVDSGNVYYGSNGSTSGNTDTSWSTPIKSAGMWGYRISVYWAKKSDNSTPDNPQFLWDDKNGVKAIVL